MKFISFICLAAVCLIASVIHVIFGSKKDGKGFVVRAITFSSIIIFSVVSTYLRGLTNIVALFISLSCCVLMLGEIIIEENKKWLSKIFSAISSALLLVAVVSLMEFKLFPLLGGLLCGLGFGFVSWAFNGEKKVINTCFDITQFILICGSISFGVINFLGNEKFLLSTIILAGCVLAFIGKFLDSLNKENKVLNMVSRGFVSIGFALIASSTYFY